MSHPSVAGVRPPSPERLRCAIDARVQHVERPCREHVTLTLALERFPPSHPGQYLQIQCAPPADSEPRVVTPRPGAFPPLLVRDFRAHEPYLRRPFSIADHEVDDSGQAVLTIISRTVGPGTAWLERLTAGGSVNITGPLGQGFRLPPEPRPLLLVGGGVGIPPLLYLTRWLHERGWQDVVAIFGCVRRDLFPLRLLEEPPRELRAEACVQLAGRARYPTLVATDDGSLGIRGRVTEVLGRWMGRPEVGGQTLVCACGPEPMLRAVAHLTRQAGLECQLCIERTMGCGLGTCLSCVVRRRDASRPGGWRWALTCTEGPVFARDELPDYD